LIPFEIGAYGGLRTGGLGYGLAAPAIAARNIGAYAAEPIINIPRPSQYSVNVAHVAPARIATPQLPVQPIVQAAIPAPLPAYKAAALAGVKGY